jgi:hypothetical protein
MPQTSKSGMPSAAQNSCTSGLHGAVEVIRTSHRSRPTFARSIMNSGCARSTTAASSAGTGWPSRCSRYTEMAADSAPWAIALFVSSGSAAIPA